MFTHFKDEETETQESEMTCPRLPKSHRLSESTMPLCVALIHTAPFHQLSFNTFTLFHSWLFGLK